MAMTTKGQLGYMFGIFQKVCFTYSPEESNNYSTILIVNI